jgi:hypothetical protein
LRIFWFGLWFRRALNDDVRSVALAGLRQVLLGRLELLEVLLGRGPALETDGWAYVFAGHLHSAVPDPQPGRLALAVAVGAGIPETENAWAIPCHGRLAPSLATMLAPGCHALSREEVVLLAVDRLAEDGGAQRLVGLQVGDRLERLNAASLPVGQHLILGAIVPELGGRGVGQELGRKCGYPSEGGGIGGAACSAH